MCKKSKKCKEKKEFSKILLIQESILIWIITLAFIGLAVGCIFFGFLGEFPWLTAMAGLPWAAYAVSQTAYYNKAKEENKIKIQQNPQYNTQRCDCEEEDKPNT